MFHERGRRWLRTVAAVVAGGALAFGASGPAAAEGPATGMARAVPGSGVTLQLDGRSMGTSALALETRTGTVPVFCIDFRTPVARNGKYVEGTWDESEVRNLGKVQWVLTHGYPNADPANLLSKAGATLPPGLTGPRRDTLLYFGTQTAVWQFSDGVRLGDWQPGLGAENEYAVIKRIHDYLVGNATDQPEPKAGLTIDPATASAPAGAKAGPFTVSGPAGEIAVRAEDGSAVDAAGRAVTTTTNGGRFWLARDGVGEVTVTVSAQDSVSFGRVFLYSGGKDEHQKLILGGSTGATVTARAGATFAAAPASPSASPSPTVPTESPSPSAPAESASPSTSAGSPAPSTSPASHGGALPLTGSPIAAAATVGVLLLAAGAVTVLIVRRRRIRFTA